MIIDYIGIMMMVYNLLKLDAGFLTLLGNGQLLDNTQPMRPPYPIIMVGFPGKISEEHLSIGYTPRPQLVVPVEQRVWDKTAAGGARNVKDMAVELYGFTEKIEEVVRANPRLSDATRFIIVRPMTTEEPVLETDEKVNCQILRSTVHVAVDMRIY